MKAVVAAFNQEKALVGAFSVITKLRICFGWNFLKHYQGVVLGVAVALAQEHRGLGAAGQLLPARGLGLGPGPRLHPEAAEGGLQRGPGLRREAACRGSAFTGGVMIFSFLSPVTKMLSISSLIILFV